MKRTAKMNSKPSKCLETRPEPPCTGQHTFCTACTFYMYEAIGLKVDARVLRVWGADVSCPYRRVAKDS